MTNRRPPKTPDAKVPEALDPVTEEVAKQKDQIAGIGKTVDTVVESVQALDEAVTEQAATTAKFSEQLDTITILLKKFPNSLDPAEHDVNEYGTAEVVTDQDSGDPVIVESRLLDVDSPEFSNKELTEAFMREKVDIHIQEVSEKFQDTKFMVAVNGRSQLFERNRSYTVPRYIVEGLARARPVHYDNEEYVGSDGVRAVRNPSHRGLRYPFQVTNDTEKGRYWLKAVMAQA